MIAIIITHIGAPIAGVVLIGVLAMLFVIITFMARPPLWPTDKEAEKEAEQKREAKKRSKKRI